ncbi:hypothetical protein KI387_035841, partial [Taxus chinensis]
ASLCKTWQLLYLCASAMCPGTELASTFLEYMHEVVKALENDSEMQAAVLTARKSLEHSMKNGPRCSIPSEEEIEAVLVGRKLKTVVFFLDGTYEDITYDITTNVGEAVQELAGIIKLSDYTTFGLFECQKTAEVPKGGKIGVGKFMVWGNAIVTPLSVTGNVFLDRFAAVKEYISLDANKNVGDILAEFKAAKECSKAGKPQFKLVFKKCLFRDTDDSITEPMFMKLSYVQSQYDYLIGNYPVGRDDGVQLAALQIFAEVGCVENLESSLDFSALVERNIPRQLASSRAKKEWEADVIAHYRTIAHLSKDEAKKQALHILCALPYGNSIFYCVRKMEDPIGFLSGRVIIAINKRG